MPKATTAIGIWTIGPNAPIHLKKLFSEKPSDTGGASSVGGRVTMKRKRATTRMRPIATTIDVAPFRAGPLVPLDERGRSPPARFFVSGGLIVEVMSTF